MCHTSIAHIKTERSTLLSLHVLQITYNPKDDFMELIEILSGNFDGSSQPVSQPSFQLVMPNPAKRKKNSRVKKA